MTEEIIKRQTHHRIPADFKWRVTNIPAGEAPFFADKFDYPVRPTHRLQIDFNLVPGKTTTILLQLVYAGNRFQEITGCPTPETVEAARVANQERGRRAAKVAELVAAIAPKLKLTVVNLYRDAGASRQSNTTPRPPAKNWLSPKMLWTSSRSRRVEHRG
jgi:hypothetical protein